jgi:hypothetical protein
MTFILILSEIKSMWVPITRAGAQAEALFTELKTRLHDRYLQHANMDIPIQRLGVMVAQVLTSKLEVQICQKALQRRSETDTDPNPEAASALLAMACNALELGLDMHSDNLLRGTRWLTSTYTEFHLLTYILWHLCVCPSGPHVARAWCGVNRHFNLVENDLSWPDQGPKWPLLVGLRAKAYKIHQTLDDPPATRPPVIPEGGVPGAPGALAVAPAAVVAGVGGSGGPGTGTGGMTGDMSAIECMNDGLVQNAEALLDMSVWDLNWVDVPDWNFLAQSLAVMGQEGGVNYPVG